MKKMLSILLAASLFSINAIAAKDPLKVGIVLSSGGLGDKSFNDSAFKGLQDAQKDFGIEFKYVEPNSAAEDEGYLIDFADAGYDLVVATGFPMKDAAQNVAKMYPDTKFAMIDEVVDAPNAKSLTFKEEEGSFLMGALAAMMSKTGTVGFVGGLNIPLIQKFERGYEAGAKYVNPDIKVISVYIGGADPFKDPLKGKEIALSEINQGADVIYHAAGSSGLGVIQAAKEAGKYAIGVDSDQDDVAPGVVLTSMLKKVNVAVYDTVKSVIDGKFEGGVHSFGIAQDGIGTSDFRNTKETIGEANLKKLDEIKAKIKSGEIVVK